MYNYIVKISVRNIYRMSVSRKDCARYNSNDVIMASPINVKSDPATQHYISWNIIIARPCPM